MKVEKMSIVALALVAARNKLYAERLYRQPERGECYDAVKGADWALLDANRKLTEKDRQMEQLDQNMKEAEAAYMELTGEAMAGGNMYSVQAFVPEKKLV